jgi:hypothetical protein
MAIHSSVQHQGGSGKVDSTVQHQSGKGSGSVDSRVQRQSGKGNGNVIAKNMKVESGTGGGRNRIHSSRMGK